MQGELLESSFEATQPFSDTALGFPSILYICFFMSNHQIVKHLLMQINVSIKLK